MICRTCQRPDLSEEDFYFTNKAAQKRMTRCKACVSEDRKRWRSTRSPELVDARKSYDREYYQQTKDRQAARVREKLYGMTTEAYQERLRAQHNRCAICEQPERALGRGGQIKDLAIDHDHETGSVRALLCSACNTD